MRSENNPLLRENASSHLNSMTVRKIAANFSSILSLLAAAVVPYLVLKSIYFLITKDEDATFHEIIKSENKLFWVIGPVISILSFLAIAPFNFYNIYKTINDGKNPLKSCKLILINLMRIIFISSGCVNAYFSNMAYKDVFNNASNVRNFFQFVFVLNALIFAGLSDSRVVINYITNETGRDWRYLKRGVNKFAHHCTKVSTRTHKENSAKKYLINKIKEKLDDNYFVALFNFDNQGIEEKLPLIDEKTWLTDLQSNKMQNYCDSTRINFFPTKRYFFSEILGSLFACGLAYYGNKNVLEFAREAILDFLIYCNLNSTSMGANIFSMIFSYIGYIISMMVSFFLIRDLFFRDICKNNQSQNFCRQIFIKFLTLIPALSFGLVNVILTMMNDQLSPVNRLIVSISAIIGATVVSRYGIEGGLNEFAGRRNHRRELADLSNQLSQEIKNMSIEELKILSIKFGIPTEEQIPLLEMDPAHSFVSNH